MLFRISHMNARLSSLALLNLGGGEIILILVVLLVLAVLAVAVFGVICLIFGVVRNQPPAVAPTSPQEVLIENQLNQERQHLRLLSILHFMFAGLALLGVGFLCVHYAGLLLWNPGMWRLPPPPFVWFYLFICVILLVSCVLNVMSGLFLWLRRHRLLSLVIGGLNCLQIPFGTALGVFTIIVLSRESVRELYPGDAS